MIVINLLWGTLATIGMVFGLFAIMDPFLAEAADSQLRMILYVTAMVGLPFLSAGWGIFLLATGWVLRQPWRAITAAAILPIPYAGLVVLSFVPSF